MSLLPEISLVMPTYNKISRLKLALCSLEKQTASPERWELVLVDDGSSQDVKEVLDKTALKCHIQYIRQANSGRSVARNHGLKAARSDLVVFMDDDLIASPQFIEAHINSHISKDKKVARGSIYELSFYKFFEDPITGKLYPELDGSSERVSGLRDKCSLLLLAFDDFEKFASIFKKNSRFEIGVRSVLALPVEKQAIPWLGFNGGNVSVRKKWIEEAGGFDEQLGKEWGAEDIELGYRLFNLGLIWQYEQVASNYHISHYRKEFMAIGRRAHEYCLKKYPSLEMKLLWPYLEGKFDIETYNYYVKENKGVVSHE